jgi:hypothetical protein
LTVAIMRAEIEELHTKLARMPAVIARAALGIIFSTSVISTLLGSWLIFRDGPWSAMIAAVGVGLAAAALVISAGEIGRLLRRVLDLSDEPV